MNHIEKTNQLVMIKFLHIAKITQPIDLYLNELIVKQGLKSNQITEFITLPKATYTIRINSLGKPLYNSTITIDGNKLIIIQLENQGLLKLDVVEDIYTMMSPLQTYRNEMTETFEYTIKKVVDQFKNIYEVVVNKLGVIVKDVYDKLGKVIIRAGDRIKRIIDRLGNMIEVVVDQAGKIIAKVVDEFEDLAVGVVNLVGNLIKKVSDQLGNMVEAVVDDFENIVGYVVDEFGNLISQVSNSLENIKDSLVDENRNEVKLSTNQPMVNIVLPNGTRIVIETK